MGLTMNRSALVFLILLFALPATAIEVDTVLTDGDSINMQAITPNSAGEGLILPQPATCTGTPTKGTVCYGDTNDELCVYDGAAWDCQPVTAQPARLKAEAAYYGATITNYAVNSCIVRKGASAYSCPGAYNNHAANPLDAQVRLKAFTCSFWKTAWDSTDSVTFCPAENDGSSVPCIGSATITVNNSTANGSVQRVVMDDLTTKTSDYSLLVKVTANDDSTAGSETLDTFCEMEYELP